MHYSHPTTQDNFICPCALSSSLENDEQNILRAGRGYLSQHTKVIICLQTFSCEKRYELLQAPRAGSAHIPRAAPAAILSLSLSFSLTSPSASCAPRCFEMVGCVRALQRLYSAIVLANPLSLSVFSPLAWAYKSIRTGFETLSAGVAGRTDAYSEPVPLLTEHDNKIRYFHGVFCTNIQWYRNIATEFTARKMQCTCSSLYDSRLTESLVFHLCSDFRTNYY